MNNETTNHETTEGQAPTVEKKTRKRRKPAKAPTGLFKRGARWYASFTTLDGRHHRTKLGTTDQKVAEARLAIIRKKIDAGDLNPDWNEIPQVRTANSFTFANLRDLYMRAPAKNGKNAKKGQAKSNTHAITAAFKALESHFGDRNLETITLADLESWIETVNKTPLPNGQPRKTAGLRRWCIILRAALRLANGRGDLKATPQKGMIIPGEEDERERICSDEEFASLVANTNPRFALFLTIAFWSGMRRDEITSIEWKHIDMTNEDIHVPKSKNGEARSVPMHPELTAALKAYPRPINGGLLFAKCYPASAYMTKLCRKLGIVDLHLHDMRHTTGTRLMNAGVNIKTIAEILGHRNLKSVMRYLNPRKNDLQRAMRSCPGLSVQAPAAAI